MTDGPDSDLRKDRQATGEPDREEQGDLLAEAVTGLFPGRGGAESKDGEAGEAPEDPTGQERAGGGGELDEDLQPDSSAMTSDPEPEAGSEPDVPQDSVSDGSEGPLFADPEEDSRVDAIPDSPWEQKMAWAKQRARDGLRDEAEELYRELVVEDPTSVRALNNLGILLDEMGRPEEAIIHLRAAKRMEPQNQEVLANLGAALGTLGRYAEAEEELRLAFRLDPSNLQVRTNLGILLFRRGLYDQAVAELEIVCRAEPDNSHPQFYRGEALNRLGRVDEAIEALETVVELAPGNSRAYFTLGVLFDKKNLPEKAAHMYRKARELVSS